MKQEIQVYALDIVKGIWYPGRAEEETAIGAKFIDQGLNHVISCKSVDDIFDYQYAGGVLPLTRFLT